ncbi:hypothetical protein M427DRAFT_52921 [Gonapodya prolifera JEL478]|uniref:Quino protein alcohol dehydrogenase-like protein n=1 Tax=Gonapodya prolifera (strain JEL478) TaxID=1344416 RepID=A0A139AS04_GONPJ|nr:hypothetical protein M427DRAFT_52921 [Gonapodya prolifera JEL478]|eukprot:KXS19489.1 hypothetical protein M427DRAFT_52921 [Gonapodya prolifera JEL478]
MLNAEPVTLVSATSLPPPSAISSVPCPSSYPNVVSSSSSSSSNIRITPSVLNTAPPPFLFAASQCRVSAVDIASGRILWKRDLTGAGFGASASVLEGGVVYFGWVPCIPRPLQQLQTFASCF